MPVAPDVQAFLSRLDEMNAPRYGEQPIDVSRKAMDDGAAAVFGPAPPVAYEETTLPGPGGPVPVRIYRPDAAAGSVVYFHGGGWVIGSTVSHHGPCAALAQKAGCTVISVDYRLAPEHPFPAAVDDAWAATAWAYEARDRLGSSGKVAVVGDSAGGTLAAVSALRARDRGMDLALQVLIYPVTDAGLDTPSYTENANGYWLTRDGMAWFYEQYTPEGDDRFHPDVSPLRAPDVSGVCPALVITAEYDVLRDEGEAYARRLEEAGVPVTLTRYDGVVHGFFRCGQVIAAGNAAGDQVAEAVHQAIAAP